MSHGYGGFTTPSGGGGPQQPDYMVYLDGAAYKAINGLTGATSFQGAVPETVVNAALNASGIGGCVALRGDAFTLAAAGFGFTHNYQKLRGVGRGTFIDGDALGTGVHALNISGKTDCVVENISVQTQDGGGKTCHGIFIEDGSHRFKLIDVIGVASDSDFIHIEGTNIIGGHIINPITIQADGRGLFSDMDGANYLYYLQLKNALITGCVGGGAKFSDLVDSKLEGIFHTNGDDGLELTTLCDGNLLDIRATLNTLWGIQIANANCDDNIVSGNVRGNTGGSYQDLGTDTDMMHLKH